MYGAVQIAKHNSCEQSNDFIAGKVALDKAKSVWHEWRLASQALESLPSFQLCVVYAFGPHLARCILVFKVE